MKKLLIPIMALLMLTVACNNDKIAKEFKLKLDSTKAEFETKMKDVKSREDYQKLTKETKDKFEALLKENEKITGNLMDLYRLEALLELNKSDEVIKKADELAKIPELKTQALFHKVNALVMKKQGKEAFELFQSIEKDLKPGKKLYEAYLNFSFEAPTPEMKKVYCEKFLAVKDAPESLTKYSNYVYQTLAYIAKDSGDVEKAKQILKDAIDKTKNEKTKASLKKELENLDMIGKPASEIKAPKWINSKALSLKKLKGKVVVIDFWATWCSPCRVVIPELAKTYNELKDKGLVVIGYTKTYGFYADDKGNQGKMDAKAEIPKIEEFVKRFNITYPIAIADSSEAFDKYGVQGIPSLYYIDKNGNIADLESGSGGKDQIKAKIIKLLEAK